MHMLSQKWAKKEPTFQTNFPNFYISEEMQTLQHETKLQQITINITD